MPEHLHRKYDRLLKTALDRVTGLDYHVLISRRYLEKLGRREEARDQARAMRFMASEVYRFLRPFKSSKASSGKVAELYTMFQPQVLPEDGPVMLGGSPQSQEHQAEGTPISTDPEHQVPELLAYFHEVRELLGSIRDVGSLDLDAEYREGL
jgi:hypothetical protein